MKQDLANVVRNRFLNKLQIFAQVHSARRHDIMAAFRTVDFSDRTKVTYLKPSSSSFLPLQVVQLHHGRTKFWYSATFSTNHKTAKRQSRLDSLMEKSIYILYARHFNLWFVVLFLYPILEGQERFLMSFFCKTLPFCTVRLSDAGRWKILGGQ